MIEFLQYLTEQLGAKWTVVLDRNNIHGKAKAVKAWLAKHPRVVIEDFPAHDPHADPDEWVWIWAKSGKLSNLCPADEEELFDGVWHTLMELKGQPGLLASSVMDVGVPLCL